MKPRLIFAVLALTVLLFLGAGQPPAQPVVKGIVIEGDSVVLTVDLPAELTRAFLQTRATLEADWENSFGFPVPVGGGTLNLSFPRQESMLFMRVMAYTGEVQTASVETVSREFKYVTLSSGTSSAAVRKKSGSTTANSPPVATLHFKAFVDGLDTIRIGREGVLWKHLQYKPVHEVTLNGRSWNPSEMDFIDLGKSSLPGDISWAHCEIEVIAGRDIVALEKLNDGAVVHIYDTPWGADEYEFKVNFFAAPAAGFKKTGTARLHISADIDGSDELVVNGKGVQWVHKQWSPPSNVAINQEGWDVVGSPVWSKELFPAGVDFRTARIVSKAGRGFVNMQTRKDDILVSFADDMVGAAKYEIEIVFGENVSAAR